VVAGSKIVEYTFLLVFNYKQADLIEVESCHGNTINSKTRFKHAYKKDRAEVRRFDETAFFISDTGRIDDKNQHIYALYSTVNHGDKQEVVPGVSDMQILYGIDTDGSRKVNKYIRASDVSDWNKILVVIISLKIQGSSLSKQKNLYIRLRARD
jgi:hypothetical protein